MRKIILSIALSLFTLSNVAAAAGINVGIAGQMGLFAATAKEAQTGNSTNDPTENRKRSEILGVGYSSVFIEKRLGDRLAIGIDYVASDIESESTEVARSDIGEGEQSNSTVENKIQVNFEDLTTIYASVNITDNSYLKLGVANVEVITNENLATGAAYGNTDLDATVIGFGFDKSFDNGMFIRTEANYMDFDGASLTSGDNTISISTLSGVSAKLALGKSF